MDGGSPGTEDPPPWVGDPQGWRTPPMDGGPQGKRTPPMDRGSPGIGGAARQGHLGDA